ncbi:MAG TPA: ribbon-helix-helix protein, CopG family [Anaerolineae bacterium]|nr:ribbon-helix-helix protein, CopG family [Anaerolineae bacterium]
MPRTENTYAERLTVKITRHMLADLTNVATKSGEPISAIVRQAIRNYLDGTDLTLGTRRTFDRRFEKRIAEMEASLKQGLAQSVEQAGQSLRQGMAQDTSRLQTLVRREVEQILAPLPAQVVQAWHEAEKTKRGWRR